MYSINTGLRVFKICDGIWTHLNIQKSKSVYSMGERSNLNHLAKDVFKLGVVDGSLEHSTRFVLVDRTGQMRGYYLTSEPDAIPRLIKDARAILES